MICILVRRFAVDAFWAFNLAHPVKVRTEVSMPSQELCQKEVDCSMFSLNRWLQLFNQSGGPSTSSVIFSSFLPKLHRACSGLLFRLDLLYVELSLENHFPLCCQ